MYITLLSHSLTRTAWSMTTLRHSFRVDLDDTPLANSAKYYLIRYTPYDTHGIFNPTILNTTMIPSIRHSFLRHHDDNIGIEHTFLRTTSYMGQRTQHNEFEQGVFRSFDILIF